MEFAGEKAKNHVHPFGCSLFSRKPADRVHIARSCAGISPRAFGDSKDARKRYDASRAICKPSIYRFATAIAVYNGGMGAQRHAHAIPSNFGNA